jgi:hypothetical protein
MEAMILELDGFMRVENIFVTTIVQIGGGKKKKGAQK